MRAPAQPRRRASEPPSRPTPAPPRAAPRRPDPRRRSKQREPAPTAPAAGPSAIGQLADRLRERRAAVRRLRWRMVTAIALSVLVVAALAWVVLASPLLVVRAADVEVTGTTTLVPEAEVLELAAGTHGEPVARVDTGALAEEIRALAAVRDVQVRRAWPNGLSIAIDGRVPVATVADGDEYAVLDAEAVTVARRAEPIEGLAQVTVPLGEGGAAAALEAVLTVLAALPDDLGEQVISAGAQTPYQVRLTLADGAEVVWGSAGENELKSEVLRTLLPTGAGVYDLSAPRAPVTSD
ncbi:FtsQ-type POTRA domain-containing protein [Ruania suaedae]|uniref:cell division protein FtsQ/DivIB n=1 Tax=Ruania suaedae TaxID=2897774 RepID=UPI001E3A9481|nr:FtsQ-type POTRA domain-containing protein [Ruania suaedae]UFU04234.1 FtsQ-type POTRA domain-containing protein [Ruania suaedae]